MKDLAELKWVCPVCGHEDSFHVHRSDVRLLGQTNADKIRSMSDEELADIWVMEQLYQPCPSEEYQDHCEAKKDCRECWLDWLKSPVEVDNGN